MKETNSNPEDARLKSLLRGARPDGALPPGFQQGVWRRVEAADARPQTGGRLELLIARILRPRIAFALAAVLVVSGSVLGVKNATAEALTQAQVRYVTAVNPNATH